jgi:hypothetical protein
MNIKRMRGRNHRGGNGGGGGNGGTQIRHHSGNTPLNRNHVFDSSGPDLRIRGTAQQLFEKYLQQSAQVTQGNPNLGPYHRRQVDQDADDAEQPPGVGDQPNPREIPISAAPSEG